MVNDMKLFLQKVSANNCGVIAVYFAVLAPLLIAIAALGTEAGLWMLGKRELQKLADTSVYTAALRWNQTNNKDAASESAKVAIQRAGLPLSDVAIELTFDDVNKKVTIILDRSLPRYFSRIFQEGTVDVRSRAVAAFEATSGGSVCIITVPSSESAAILVTGSGNVEFDGCTIYSNSTAEDSISIQGSGTLEVDCLYTAGGIQQRRAEALVLPMDGVCSEPKTKVQALDVTLKNLNFPERVDYVNFSTGVSTIDDENCDDTKKNESSDTGASCNGDQLIGYLPGTFAGMPVGYFPDGLILSGDIVLESGIYVVDDELEFKSRARVKGDGVLFLLADGAELKLAANNISVDLVAPSTGELGGILFASVGSNATGNYQINGGSSKFTGVFYFPDGNVRFSGGGTVVNPSCIQFVVKTITFIGNSGLEVSCTEGIPSGTQIVTIESSVVFLTD